MVVPAASKQEATYRVLRERIMEGVYAPGHRLVIDAIARELGVSAMPVREAIRRLEAEGWVTFRRNQGAQVAPIDASAWAETMATLAVLEGFATALAMEHLGEADIAALRAIDGEMGEALEAFDVLRFAERNRAFHELIYARCPNGQLRRQLATDWERLDSVRTTVFSYIPMRGRESIDEHERLVDMLARRDDPDAVERFARTHKLHTVDALRRRQQEDAR